MDTDAHGGEWIEIADKIGGLCMKKRKIATAGIQRWSSAN
jgi:hypothetical protein